MRLLSPMQRLLLLLQLNIAVGATFTDQRTCSSLTFLTGICVLDDGTQAEANGGVRSSGVLDCAARCASRDCVGCVRSEGSAPVGYRRLNRTDVSVRSGDCDMAVRSDRAEQLVNAQCPENKINSAAFLVEFNNTEISLSDFLCYQSCRQLAKNDSRFATISNASATTTRRCVPLDVSAYFASTNLTGAGSSAHSLIAVSVQWRQAFTSETCCTHQTIPNVPPVTQFTWSQAMQLDLCAQACVWRPTCEFFIFNVSGCYQGSLSRYLNSRQLNVSGSGCVIWHKTRSWAASMRAYYTFNSSLLNLADPTIMPAVNTSVLNISADGFLVPFVQTSHFVRLNLSHIGFDALVRGNTPITFVFSFLRHAKHNRSDLALIADCQQHTTYNGAINEQSNGNEGWFLNSLTGQWQTVNSQDASSSSFSLPNNNVIHLALAINSSSGYYVINGAMINSRLTNWSSSYGVEPSSIGCMYFGSPSFSFIKSLFGRIKLLGIFTRMLTANEVMELV